MEINTDFVKQIHADLHWLINSHGLIANLPDFVNDESLPSRQTDIDTALTDISLIESVFNPRKHLVGHYFEQLVLFWLKANPDFRNIHQHIRLLSNHKTVGELDFVFDDIKFQTTRHWEVAVKFYLFHGHQFIGPNPTDTFEKKFNNLRQQQLPRSESNLAKQILAQLGFNLPLINQSLLKGWLFYPADSDWQNPPLILEAISPKHSRGWWTSINQLQLPANSTQSRWLILDKPYWFALPNLQNKRLFDHDELAAYLYNHFNHTHHALFLAELVQNKNQWQEKSRGFVVHANWPQT